MHRPIALYIVRLWHNCFKLLHWRTSSYISLISPSSHIQHGKTDKKSCSPDRSSASDPASGHWMTNFGVKRAQKIMNCNIIHTVFGHSLRKTKGSLAPGQVSRKIILKDCCSIRWHTKQWKVKPNFKSWRDRGSNKNHNLLKGSFLWKSYQPIFFGTTINVLPAKWAKTQNSPKLPYWFPFFSRYGLFLLSTESVWQEIGSMWIIPEQKTFSLVKCSTVVLVGITGGQRASKSFFRLFLGL